MEIIAVIIMDRLAIIVSRKYNDADHNAYYFPFEYRYDSVNNSN